MLRILLTLLFWGASLPLFADTLWLTNGDRISGTVLALEGGKAVVQTPYAGRVLIDWTQVRTLSTDKPLMVRRDGLDSREESLQAAEPGQVRLSDGAGHDRAVTLASITRLVEPRPLLKDRRWEGNLDASLDLQRDQSRTNDWQVKGDTRIEYGRWRHVISGEYNEQRQDGEQIEENAELQYDLDRFLSPNWFVRGTIDLQRDDFSELERQRSLGVGPGYRFWDDELGRFDLIGQVTRFHLQSRDRELDFNALTLAWDFKQLLGATRFELYSKAQLQVPEIDAVDYVLDSEYGLRYRLNDWARISLLYELDQGRVYDQTQSKRHYTLGLGVGW